MGYGIVATAGTKAALEAGGVSGVEGVLKIQEGRPNAGDLMVNKDITMLMITTTGACGRAASPSRVQGSHADACGPASQDCLPSGRLLTAGDGGLDVSCAACSQQHRRLYSAVVATPQNVQHM